jgi:hypothetical protein
VESKNIYSFSNQPGVGTGNFLQLRNSHQPMGSGNDKESFGGIIAVVTG